MRILITGISGTGKTTVGEYLKTGEGFLHMDMESDEDLGYLKISDIQNNSKDFIEGFINKSLNIVITWGFVPSDLNIEIINLLKNDYGFKLFWFDGDRESARKAFIERSKIKGEKYLGVAMNELNSLMFNIDNSNVVDRINPIQLNTFDVNHNFKTPEEVTSEVLSFV